MIIHNPFVILDNFLNLPVSALSNSDWDILDNLTKHTNYEVRLYLSEILSYLYCTNSEKILLKMLDDNEKLVVASVCDALSLSNSKQVLDKLKKCTKSSHFIVRGYSYMSIGEILNKKSTKTIELVYLTNSIEREKSKWVKASIAYSLCLNGYCNNLSYIVNLLNNRYYNYRIYALNLISSLLTKQALHNKKDIMQKLLTLSKTEKNRIVYSKTRNLIAQIENELFGTNQGKKNQSGDGSLIEG